MTIRQDKFGYYQVGEFKTYSKLEAVELQNRTNQTLHWRFNEEAYSSLDWHQEPTQTLAELYRQRAQQLRDQYDHLVIWFSGGADSTNILRSFVDNDIKLDEVVSYVNYSATGSKEDAINGEVFHVAAPLLDKIQQTQPWIKHRIIDLAGLEFDFFADKKNSDWIYEMNRNISPHNSGKQNIKSTVPEWQELANSGKKVCHIYGVDKPKITQVGDKFLFHFFDDVDKSVTPRSQMLDNPWEFNELFYWTPDLLELVIKQCHVIKQYLLATPALENTWSTGMPYVIVKGDQDRYLSYDTVHALLYPGWFQVPFQVKPASLVFSHRDDWFFGLSDQESAKRIWRNGLEKMWQTIPESMKRNPKDIARGIWYTTGKIYTF